MSAKIIGTCSLCNGPVAVVDPWLGTFPAVPACQRCGATKKDPYGPVIEMTPYKGLPGTIQPSTIDWKIGNPTCTNPFADCVVVSSEFNYGNSLIESMNSLAELQKTVKQLKEESKWPQN